MAFKFNPFTGALDVVNIVDDNFKIQWALESIRALDKVVDLEYQEFKKERIIIKATYSSVDYPDVDIVKNIYYLDEFTINQRIDRIEYVGIIFNGSVIRKTYKYSPDKLKMGFEYEVI